MAHPTPSISEGLAPDDLASARPGPAFLKLTPGQKLTVTVLSSKWLGAITHFARGRMKLHVEPDCPYCAAGGGKRFHCWLYVITPPANRDWIVQFAGGQHKQLFKQTDLYGTLRGSTAFLKRPGSAPNTPLTILFNGPPALPTDLPPEIDLQRLILRYLEWRPGFDNLPTNAETPPTKEATP